MVHRKQPSYQTAGVSILIAKYEVYNHSLSLVALAHRLNMELAVIFYLELMCTAVLIGWGSATATTPGGVAEPPPPQVGLCTRALLVNQDRRHIFVTPCFSHLHSVLTPHPSHPLAGLLSLLSRRFIPVPEATCQHTVCLCISYKRNE